MDDGIALENARVYALEGCVRPFLPTSSGGANFSENRFNGPKLLELVMYNGWDPRTGKQFGPQTGDPRTFTSIEDWIKAWEKQCEYWGEPTFGRIRNFAFHFCGLIYATPFTSALADDCIEKGADLIRGGGRYPQLYGLTLAHVRANMADSLMAIKKFVYDEHKLTIDEILDACSHDFEGGTREQIRQMLLSAPKYGNDEDEPDEIMKSLSIFLSKNIRSCPNPYGYPTREGRNGAAGHVTAGMFVGALPDGRKAYTPLADGGCSPTAGADHKGPTAVLRSAYKTVDVHVNSETVLNQKLSPSLVNTREKHHEGYCYG